MNANDRDEERCLELLAKRALRALDEAEAAALEECLARVPGAPTDGFEPAAAALTLASTLTQEPLPPSLRARLIAEGEERLARAPHAHPRPRPGRALAGWWAAAAALVLAVAGWYPRFASAPPHATAAELRERLLASGVPLVRAAFEATSDPGSAGATGDVVFDGASQNGFLRLRLAANDPRRSVYQLWIFDAERDARFPVDGGVFDVPAGTAEVVVPIRAAVPVGRATLFAVTVERPGGVVVSTREHVVALAKVAGA